MKILLTGGTGFVGGRLAQWLAGNGDHEVLIGTRSTARPAGAVDGTRIRVLDWSSDASLAAACHEVDAVVHLAGMNAAQCAADPAAALANYGQGTAMLARAALRQSVRRFVYVSSAHVYGAALVGKVDEDVQPQPQHPYALSHAAAEQAVMASRGQGLQASIARLSNAFGAPLAAGANCWTLLVNDLCRQAVVERRMVLRTAGTQRRDFVPLSEACRAIGHLIGAPVDPAIFNVGSGAALRVVDMAGLIGARVRDLLGFTPALEVGQALDPVGGGLEEYSIARLQSSGFAARTEAIREELDRLILFCESAA